MTVSAVVYVVDPGSELAELLTEMGAHAWRVERFARAEDFLARFNAAETGCVLTELKLNGRIDGLGLIELLAVQWRSIPIIVASTTVSVPLAVRAIQGGAFHVLEQPCDATTLQRCIDDALAIDAQNVEPRRKLATLTDRQRTVAEMLTAGRNTKEIAVSLGLSPKTIEKHRTSLLAKIGADSIVVLMRLLRVRG